MHVACRHLAAWCYIEVATNLCSKLLLDFGKMILFAGTVYKLLKVV